MPGHVLYLSLACSNFAPPPVYPQLLVTHPLMYSRLPLSLPVMHRLSRTESHQNHSPLVFSPLLKVVLALLKECVEEEDIVFEDYVHNGRVKNFPRTEECDDGAGAMGSKWGTIS